MAAGSEHPPSAAGWRRRVANTCRGVTRAGREGEGLGNEMVELAAAVNHTTILSATPASPRHPRLIKAGPNGPIQGVGWVCSIVAEAAGLNTACVVLSRRRPQMRPTVRMPAESQRCEA